MGMSTDCLLLGQKKGLSILERCRHARPYIVLILHPLYGFMLRIYIYIYIHNVLSSSARCLYSNEFSSALTEHLLLCPCYMCVWM